MAELAGVLDALHPEVTWSSPAAQAPPPGARSPGEDRRPGRSGCHELNDPLRRLSPRTLLSTELERIMQRRGRALDDPALRGRLGCEELALASILPMAPQFA